MKMPEQIRIGIADRLVRTFSPFVLFCLAINVAVFFMMGGRQYHRLIPTAICFVVVLPAWILALKGKPLLGVKVLLVCLCATIVSAMAVSGGIHAPAYVLALPFLTLFVLLYGIWGGVIFATAVLFVGGLFVWFDRLGMLRVVEDPPDMYYLFLFGLYMTVQIWLVQTLVRLMYKALSDAREQSRELALAAQEQKRTKTELASILDNTPDIIYRLDPDGRIIFVNEAVEKYGYASKNLLGKSFAKYVHPDEKKTAVDALSRNRDGSGQPQDFEIRLLPRRHSSGEVKKDDWPVFHVTSRVLEFEDESAQKTVSGIQGIARDITRQKAYERQLVRFATVIEQADEEVVITDPKGRIQYVNPSFEKNTGYTEEEVLGSTPAILKSGLQSPSFYHELWSTILNRKIWKGTIRNRCKKGDLILHDMSITPILDNSGEISAFVSIRRDITEKEKTERRIQQAQKMEAIGTLASGIAHDFNNILAGILGYSELLQEDLEEFNLPDAAKEKMKRVTRASLRAKDLVMQILNFSRSGREKPSPIKVSLIAKEVLKLLRASFPSYIGIESNIRSDSLVMADPTGIHQIFMNLCTNARDALGDEGGTLTLSLEDCRLDAEAVRDCENVVPGPFLYISVQDTGHGMEKDLLKNIFEPFFTTKPQGKGTGMGLSVVNGIVGSLGGFVRVSSSPGKGSVFKVFLPECREDAAQTVEKQDHESRVSTGNESILFVDDETVLAEMNRDSLESFGYKVTIFSDSLAALEEFKANHGAYDMVISDMTMPGMTGDVLAGKIRSIRPDIPVILFTGFSDLMDEQRALAMGINAFLYKPVPLEKMLLTIRSLFDGGQHGPYFDY